MVSWIWLALIVVGIVIEAASPQLVAIWFVLGGIGALIASLCGVEIWIQVVIAVAISVISLIATRPFIKKMTARKIEHTNADRYIGKEGVVTSEINDVLGTGRVTVLGSSWAAITDAGMKIAEGSKVTVEAIEGVKLRVKAVN